ncbi:MULTISPECIES: SpoIIE family protein phosphatase [unclassified Microcoleus]|uniref:SpoIIE family protein phosphatase n=1 Tax=unclassified Microcoleus TaxID=2642155 RepID=UPI002FD48AC2
MKLQRQILLTTIGLVSLALVPTVALLTWTSRHALLAQTEAQGKQVAQSLARSAQFVEKVPKDVENTIADHMLAQATISAHLVAIAEAANLSPQQINQRLSAIAKKSVVEEFWITDETGRAYLKNAPFAFTFSPDRAKQPQASMFWPLLTGAKSTVVQDAQVREYDKQIYKYVAVAGVDRPRIVQVGYNASFIERLRQQVGINGLIKRLLTSGEIGGIWVVGLNATTNATGVADNSGLSQILSPTDTQRLEDSIAQKLTQSYQEDGFLKVATPLIDETGQITGAILVSLSTKPVQAALQNQLLWSLTVSAVVLIISSIVALLLSWRLTQPVLQLSEAASSLSTGNWDQTVHVQGTDEMHDLATAFNKMSGQLKESFATLEDKVKERTAELGTANEEIIALNERLKEDNLRMGAELDIVRQMQQMILPTAEELKIEGLDIAAYMEAADEVGGDYYDVLNTDGVVTLGIGDVTGHGLESAILMLMAQTAVRTLKEIREVDPVRFLDALNRTLYKNVQRMKSHKSLTLGILNYSQGLVSISGQHEETIIVRNGGQVERVDTMDLGFPIGLHDDIAEFISHISIELQLGDGIVLYTDGIPEAKDIKKKQYGVEPMCEVISKNWHLSAGEIKQAVIDDVRRHIGNQKVFDDITLLVLKRTELGLETESQPQAAAVVESDREYLETINL